MQPPPVVTNPVITPAGRRWMMGCLFGTCLFDIGLIIVLAGIRHWLKSQAASDPTLLSSVPWIFPVLDGLVWTVVIALVTKLPFLWRARR